MTNKAKKRDFSRYKTVRLSPDAYERLEELLEIVAVSGWTAVGSKRNERVTFVSVMNEAVDQLASRAERRRNPTRA